MDGNPFPRGQQEGVYVDLVESDGHADELGVWEGLCRRL